MRLGDILSNLSAFSQNIVVKALWSKPHLRRGQNLTYEKLVLEKTIHNNFSKANFLKVSEADLELLQHPRWRALWWWLTAGSKALHLVCCSSPRSAAEYCWITKIYLYRYSVVTQFLGQLPQKVIWTASHVSYVWHLELVRIEITQKKTQKISLPWLSYFKMCFR